MASHCDQARARVGASALKIYHNCGRATAIEIYKGGFAALTLYLLATLGRESTRDYFDYVLSEIKPPRSKPELIVNNTIRHIPICDGAA